MKPSYQARIKRLEQTQKRQGGCLVVPAACALEEWLAQWQHYNPADNTQSIFSDGWRPAA